VASTLSVWADVWRLQGKHSESLKALRRILEIQRGALPSGHPAISASLNNLGFTLLELKRYEESLPTLKEALQLHVQALGPHHADVTGMMMNLATNHELIGEDDEADKIYQRAMRLAKGSDNETTQDAQLLGRYGKLLYKMGRHEEALDSARGALGIWRHLRYKADDMVYTTASTLGVTLHALGRHDEAQGILQGIASVQRNQYGEADVRTAQTEANLGAVLHANGQQEEALAMLRSSERVLLQQVGPDDPRLKATQQNIIAVQTDLERRAMAPPPEEEDVEPQMTRIPVDVDLPEVEDVGYDDHRYYQ